MELGPDKRVHSCTILILASGNLICFNIRLTAVRGLSLTPNEYFRNKFLITGGSVWQGTWLEEIWDYFTSKVKWFPIVTTALQ